MSVPNTISVDGVEYVRKDSIQPEKIAKDYAETHGLHRETPHWEFCPKCQLLAKKTLECINSEKSQSKEGRG